MWTVIGVVAGCLPLPMLLYLIVSKLLCIVKSCFRFFMLHALNWLMESALKIFNQKHQHSLAWWTIWTNLKWQTIVKIVLSKYNTLWPGIEIKFLIKWLFMNLWLLEIAAIFQSFSWFSEIGHLIRNSTKRVTPKR